MSAKSKQVLRRAGSKAAVLGLPLVACLHVRQQSEKRVLHRQESEYETVVAEAPNCSVVETYTEAAEVSVPDLSEDTAGDDDAEFSENTPESGGAEDGTMVDIINDYLTANMANGFDESAKLIKEGLRQQFEDGEFTLDDVVDVIDIGTPQMNWKRSKGGKTVPHIPPRYSNQPDLRGVVILTEFLEEMQSEILNSDDPDEVEEMKLKIPDYYSFLYTATVTGNLPLIKAFAKSWGAVDFARIHDEHTSILSPIQIAYLNQDFEIYDFFRARGISEISRKADGKPKKHFSKGDYIYKCLQFLMERNKNALEQKLLHAESRGDVEDFSDGMEVLVVGGNEKYRNQRAMVLWSWEDIGEVGVRLRDSDVTTSFFNYHLKAIDFDVADILMDVQHLQEDLIESYLHRDRMLRDKWLPEGDARALLHVYNASSNDVQAQIDEILTKAHREFSREIKMLEAIERLAKDKPDEPDKKMFISLHPDNIKNIFFPKSESHKEERYREVVEQISNLVTEYWHCEDQLKKYDIWKKLKAFVQNQVIRTNEQCSTLVPGIHMLDEDGMVQLSREASDELARQIGRKLADGLQTAKKEDMQNMLDSITVASSR